MHNTEVQNYIISILPCSNVFNNFNQNDDVLIRPYIHKQKSRYPSTEESLQVCVHPKLHTKDDWITAVPLGQWASKQDAVVKGRNNRIFKPTLVTNRKRVYVVLSVSVQRGWGIVMEEQRGDDF